ncbi:SDR family NAD(P)-dependent oxidoreductase [Vallicoccus soli]|uniref:SDR family NAD(P)-dependent oxidoreductase n=1 Tax=Vallicoccus soli TaxID=2339232 RepID=A0A3A3ZLJ4_9ACTN|nr:SDR family NAD(P)-dependent oxidoreductase [Vallicoccus soli]RJK97106.1 SDR family NAD(P)-dependent oxidoreductase [Vallicoccus soli]
MSSVLVTGSSDGIGAETARALVALGHRVVLHARNGERADDARAAVPGADGVLVADLASLAEVRAMGGSAGAFDVVVHNAGVGGGAAERSETVDGIERILAVNVLAPYVLTALMPVPRRLVYLTSGLESQGRADLDDLQSTRGPWDGMQAYSDSKLWDVVLALAVARLQPGTVSNAVDPGWIRTRMGGPGATDDLADGAETQVWLATSDEPAATASGRYLKRRRELRAHPAAYDTAVQDGLLAACAELTGVRLTPR